MPTAIVASETPKQRHWKIRIENGNGGKYKTRSVGTKSHVYSVSQKSNSLKLFADFLSWRICITENYFGYCPSIFLCLHQFWSIYLNICVKCIIFTGEIPQILRIQFSFLTKFMNFS